jgi:YfiH family protein
VYASLNLGDHVGDDTEPVHANRAHLRAALSLPAEPVWLKQVHGVNVVDAARAAAGIVADGAFTHRRGVVLAVLTADCLPVFLCDRAGESIALLHAGWRGLAAGVIEAGIRAMGVTGDRLMAHIGPGIGPDAYEVGEEVRAAFVHLHPDAANAFRAVRPGHWFADMAALARLRLRAAGVLEITGGDRCTAREPEHFFSFRRDGVTGRMASLLWMA